MVYGLNLVVQLVIKVLRIQGICKRLYSLRSAKFPKGPYTVHLRTLLSNAIPGIAFGTRVLKWAVYGPLQKSDVARVRSWPSDGSRRGLEIAFGSGDIL